MLPIKHKSRACDARLLSQINFDENFTSTLRAKQLIRLAQWLYDECHSHEANTEIIIREFFKKTNEMRLRWL